jgi:hypothetical protein
MPFYSSPPKFLLIIFSISLSFPFCRPAVSADTLTVAAVGDIMMGTTWPQDILPPDDGEGIFDNVVESFLGADIVFGNLEGPLIEGGKGIKCGKNRRSKNMCFEFRMPPRYVRHLETAGFDVLNIANNHSFDFGPEGIENTVMTLDEAGIQATGGENVATFYLKEKFIAVIGFSYSPPSPHSFPVQDLEAAAKTIAMIKDDFDIVIVSFHGGGEGKDFLQVADADEIFAGANRGNVVRFARTAIDSGADLVLGHGPHVPRALEIYKGKLIAYSLGNFLTYGRFNIQGPSGISLVLKAEIDTGTGDFLGGRIVPVELRDRGIPSPDPEGKAVNLIRKLTVDRGITPVPVIEDDGRILPVCTP